MRRWCSLVHFSGVQWGSEPSNGIEIVSGSAEVSLLCDVYKGSKKNNIYLYVDHDIGLSNVPEELLEQFGEIELALSFKLSEMRSLAKENPAQVLASLTERGYFMQLPPVEHP